MRPAPFAPVAAATRLALALAPAPALAAGETLRCDSPKHSGAPRYLRVAAGRLELGEGMPLAWRDYCRPSEAIEQARCRSRRGHALAAVTNVDVGRELDFDPRRNTLIVRDWATIGGLRTRFLKLHCAVAAAGEGPPG